MKHIEFIEGLTEHSENDMVARIKHATLLRSVALLQEASECQVEKSFSSQTYAARLSEALRLLAVEIENDRQKVEVCSLGLNRAAGEFGDRLKSVSLRMKEFSEFQSTP